jgi:hypothetical protein
MRFHDYHLIGYEVRDRGETIVFDLLFDYPEHEKLHSKIKFHNVVVYNFIHTNQAIILDIEELPVDDLLEEVGDSMAEWSRLQGVLGWSGDLQHYKQYLDSNAYKAWRIESAIGFYGFVVAKAVSNV